jgi:hypothetical protein
VATGIGLVRYAFPSTEDNDGISSGSIGSIVIFNRLSPLTYFLNNTDTALLACMIKVTFLEITLEKGTFQSNRYCGKRQHLNNSILNVDEPKGGNRIGLKSGG